MKTKVKVDWAAVSNIVANIRRAWLYIWLLIIFFLCFFLFVQRNGVINVRSNHISIAYLLKDWKNAKTIETSLKYPLDKKKLFSLSIDREAVVSKFVCLFIPKCHFDANGKRLVNDWFCQQAKLSTVSLCQEVKESCSLYFIFTFFSRLYETSHGEGCAPWFHASFSHHSRLPLLNFPYLID